MTLPKALTSLILIYALLQSPSFAADGAPTLSLPIDCALGKNCWVQNLPDVDPGPAAVDPDCGRATFNDHKGTDIRLRDLGVNAELFPILAMAPGKVIGLRDAMADHLVEGPEDVRKIENRECGNGVMLEHPGGWTTQYCHFRLGSVAVKTGQMVERGQKLGVIGLSGHTTFPHIHVTVRKGKEVINPASGKRQHAKCGTHAPKNRLWDSKATAALNRPLTAMIRSGFVGKGPSSKDVLKDKLVAPNQARPLIFFASFINLKKGDRIAFRIDADDKRILNHTGKPIPAPKAFWTAWSGRPKFPKSASSVTGEATLLRNGKIIATSGPVRLRL